MTTHPYLVTIARSDTRMVHRSTCKKALANASATPSDDFTVGKAATCCKPRPLPVSDTTQLAEDLAQAFSMTEDEAVAAVGRALEVPTAPAPKGKRAGRLEVKVRFVRNGEPMPDSQNKLASVAYYHTKDVEPGKDRCTTGRLREILAEAGVAAPEAEPWGPVTLSNGVVLEATAL